MPGRNIYKEYVADSYYHIYNRGVNKQVIFRDKKDYVVFLGLLRRYLSPKPERNSNGVLWPTYFGKVELLAYCLMPNHFHLFIYQHTNDAMQRFLKSLSVAYSMYFNKRYKRTGPLFEQRYRASRISDDAYLLHISRYIHLNPSVYDKWEWSSLPNYLGKRKNEWLLSDRIMDLFSGDYKKFVDEYKNRRDELDDIKHELANDDSL